MFGDSIPKGNVFISLGKMANTISYEETLCGEAEFDSVSCIAYGPETVRTPQLLWIGCALITAAVVDAGLSRMVLKRRGYIALKLMFYWSSVRTIEDNKL